MLDTDDEAHDLPKRYRQLIEGVSRSSRRMNRLVADLLEFARVSFGDAMPVQRVATDVGLLITDVLAEVRASYPDRVFEHAASGMLQGEWDADRLFQAVINLVSNAVHHGSANTPIRVSARGEADVVSISAHNSGRPIPPAQLARMSRDMSPGVSSDDRDRRHLGLGLYIVDRIVAAHGGQMLISSQADDGTTFVLRLPRADTKMR